MKHIATMDYQIGSLNESRFYFRNNSIAMDFTTLEDYNDNETKRRIVPLAFLSLLTFLGIPGNVLILYIYIFKFKKKATHRTLVVALAISDLLNCTFTIPFEITQMTHEYTFYVEWPCKVGRLINAIFTKSSAFVLVFLSVDRYWRICHPMRRQLSSHKAIKCIACLWCFAIFIAWPEYVLAGIKFHHLGNNLTGFDCSNKEGFNNSDYPLMHSTAVLCVYIFCMMSLLTMCFFIGREIVNHDNFVSQFRASVMFRARFAFNSENNNIGDMFKTKKSLHIYKRRQGSVDSNRKSAKSPMKVTRTVLIVSICFVIVFFPFIVIKLLAALNSGNIMPPSKLASILLPTLSRSHFINNVLNFIIYISMDKAFKTHFRRIVSSIGTIIVNLIKKF